MQDLGINILFDGRNFLRLMEGLLSTVEIALISVILSAVFGIVLGIVMTSKNRLVRFVTRLYLETIRIIPILVLLFLFYFTLSRMVNWHLSGFAVSVLVFTLWGTAEMGDLVRGVVTSLPQHQRESGRAIGLKEWQIYLYIVVPQAVRRLLPSAINLATRMVKTTSLVMLIGVIELLKVGQQIIEVSILKTPTASFWVYGFIFFLYFMLCYPVSLFSRFLETRWQQ